MRLRRRQSFDRHICRRERSVRLRTLLIVTDTDVTLGVKAVGPESTEINVGLGHALVAEKEPESENRLGHDVENGIGDDFSVDAGLAGAISDTPDAIHRVSESQKAFWRRT